MRPGKSFQKHINFIVSLARSLQNHVYSPCRERPPVLRDQNICWSLYTGFTVAQVISLMTESSPHTTVTNIFPILWKKFYIREGWVSSANNHNSITSAHSLCLFCTHWYKNASIILTPDVFPAHRSCLLSQVPSQPNVACPLSLAALQAYGAVMSIGSSRASKLSVLGTTNMEWLPAPVRTVIEKWNSGAANEFPTVGAWVGSLTAGNEFPTVGTWSGCFRFI